MSTRIFDHVMPVLGSVVLWLLVLLPPHSYGQRPQLAVPAKRFFSLEACSTLTDADRGPDLRARNGSASSPAIEALPSSRASWDNSNTWTPCGISSTHHAEAISATESSSSALPSLTWASFNPQAQQNIPQGQKEEKGSSSPSSQTGSPGHIFWVIPAYKVDYMGEFKPISPREKFQEWAQSEYDPLGLAAGAAEAGTLEYSSKDGFCGYGHGWGGYGECFGSMQLDAAVSSFIGDYALAVLLHQDPRYFRLGKGGFAKRVIYTVSRVFITYSDAGRNTFYTSGLSGTVIAGAISNLYYPQQDRGVSPTISRIGLDLGNTALYDAAAEFWPDFHRSIHSLVCHGACKK